MTTPLNPQSVSRTPMLVALIDQLAAAYTKAVIANPKCVVHHNIEQAVEQCPLIIEAGILATITGLTPRQLEEQRQELLEALKGIVRVADRKTVEFDKARAAIANAEGRS
jgi:hypothetical protein